MCNSILFCRLWYLQQRKVRIHLKQSNDVLISLVSLYAYILKLGMAQFVPQLSSEYRELMQLLCVATTPYVVNLLEAYWLIERLMNTNHLNVLAIYICIIILKIRILGEHIAKPIL